MLSSVLRILSPTLDPDAFLAAHPDLEPDAVWRAGETGPRGRVHQQNGFTLSLGEASKWEPLLQHTLAQLEKLRPMLDDARSRGASLMLDFGLIVGLSKAFTQSATFSPSDLQRFVELGLEVHISAYPGQE